MNEIIRPQLKILPEASGCYQFFDEDGELIYIGKAKNLKKRVSSYFNKNHSSPKLLVMTPQIVKIEFIVTDNEIEALILESHLIKKHKPKYNVLLKDDKKFPYFVITKEEYPRIVVARKSNRNKVQGKYFGPYTDGRAMYSTLDLIKKLFPLKQCKNAKFKDRPCLYYDIGKCFAPCQKLISVEEYQKILKNVELFLTGKQDELVEQLRLTMIAYADKHQFEKAARYRDSYFDVQKTMEHQKVISENTKLNQDVIAVKSELGIFAITLLKIRFGRLIEKRDFEINADKATDDSEILSSFIKEYYQLCDQSQLPKEILLSENLPDEETEVFEKWLSAMTSNKVRFLKLGSKKNKEMVELSKKNAGYFLEKLKVDRISKLQNDYNEVGSYIQEKLGLKKFPNVVECFDISHIQGSNTVASMVVFEEGQAKKGKYKKFKIHSTESMPDDFKSMQEVIARRYSRVLKNNESMPDLIIIDGGKGQLSSVMETFKELGIENQAVVSLAKRLEEVFLPKRRIPVVFPSSSNALYFFQRIRDEAHRFAINYHRKLRENEAKKSVLDEIKGLGRVSRSKLLKEFKTAKAISKLSREQLEKVVGKRTAKTVFEFFNSI